MKPGKFIYLLIFLLPVFSSCEKKADRLDYRSLGTSANDLLSSARYTSLTLEIQYMPGHALDPVTINNIITFLNKYCNKPAGIKVISKQINASGKPSLTLAEIVDIEKQARQHFTLGEELTVHILITDGVYSSANILALSYFNTSFCIFGKTINDNSGGLFISRPNLLTTIMEHEMGHLMGLVAQGSPMQADHKDPANGAHCDKSSCLMYYGIESSDQIIRSVNNSGSIPLLDANCIADLKANGGK